MIVVEEEIVRSQGVRSKQKRHHFLGNIFQGKVGMSTVLIGHRGSKRMKF